MYSGTLHTQSSELQAPIRRMDCIQKKLSMPVLHFPIRCEEASGPVQAQPLYERRGLHPVWRELPMPVPRLRGATLRDTSVHNEHSLSLYSSGGQLICICNSPYDLWYTKGEIRVRWNTQQHRLDLKLDLLFLKLYTTYQQAHILNSSDRSTDRLSYRAARRSQKLLLLKVQFLAFTVLG